MNSQRQVFEKSFLITCLNYKENQLGIDESSSQEKTLLSLKLCKMSKNTLHVKLRKYRNDIFLVI